MSQTITKSIRLSMAESAEIARLSAQTATSEAALLKQWVLRGVQSHKLDLAVQAYMNDRVDIRGGAQMAGVSYNRFMHELEDRRVLILDDDRFLDRLSALADLFEDKGLKEVAQKVAEQPDQSIDDSLAP
ncbi:MAG: hypothetical protein HY328_00395 [Chloroflexi bacterium]|nr:hypothetical protein [Chloroflexota bacterium]